MSKEDTYILLYFVSHMAEQTNFKLHITNEKDMYIFMKARKFINSYKRIPITDSSTEDEILDSKINEIKYKIACFLAECRVEQSSEIIDLKTTN